MENLREFKRLWHDTFRDSHEWMEMYFKRYYTPQSAVMNIDASTGRSLSQLLLVPYSMILPGEVKVQTSYISGAATAREMRGKGLMRSLLTDALKLSYHRGDVLCTLIPAHRWLYDFYSRFGFATVFYIDEQRYTAAHKFIPAGQYTVSRVTRTDQDLIDRFARCWDKLSRSRECFITHDVDEFGAIISDTLLDNGVALLLTDSKGDDIGIALAVKIDGRVIVRELLATDSDANEALLAEVQAQFPITPFTVIMPAGRVAPIEARGMARVINVLELLKVYAPRMIESRRMTIRVHDPIIEENNRTFLLTHKGVSIIDESINHVDLDVDVSVLISILFSAKQAGDVFGFATHRSYMSMMLD